MGPTTALLIVTVTAFWWNVLATPVPAPEDGGIPPQWPMQFVDDSGNYVMQLSGLSDGVAAGFEMTMSKAPNGDAQGADFNGQALQIPNYQELSDLGRKFMEKGSAYEKRRALPLLGKRRALPLLGKRRALPLLGKRIWHPLAGYGKPTPLWNPLSVENAAANKRRALPLLGKRRALPLLGKRRALPLLGKRRALPLLGKRRALPLLGKRRALPLLGKRRALPLLGKRYNFGTKRRSLPLLG